MAVGVGSSGWPVLICTDGVMVAGEAPARRLSR
jgi:hypothetical protein